MQPSRPTLRLGHSPDPDDAFMWWPLLEVDGAPPRLETGRFRFEAVVDDIESLNRRSAQAELEITAMSCAQYPFVRGPYALTDCGASLGEGYGPKLVAREAVPAEFFRLDPARETTPVIAVPGERTSALGALRLMLGTAFRYAVVPFEEIIDRVAGGEFEGGLVIHEGQLTYGAAGLHLVEDLGAWWLGRFGLPIPLGVNAIRRDLETRFGPGSLVEITGTLRRSVEYALAQRGDSIRYALRFARDMGAEQADEFVRLYVTGRTLDFGEAGRAAVHTFLRELAEAGHVPDPGPVDFIGAGAAA